MRDFAASRNPVRLTIVLVFAMGLLACSQKKATEDANILLIVVDTLRADFLGCYGSERVKTPAIDGLARSGVRFESAFSHIPITGPSHASLFSGRFPSDVQVLNNAQVFPASASSLPMALQSSGRATFGAISLGVLKSEFGFHRGFDVYREDLGEAYQADASAVNRKVVEWLESSPQLPYFAFVHYSDPHEPYFSHGLREAKVTISMGEEVAETVDIAATHYVSLPLDLPPGKTELRLRCERDFRLRGSWVAPAGAPVQILPQTGWRKDEAESLATQDGTLILVNRQKESIHVDLKLYLSEILSLEEVKASYAAEVEFVDRAIGELLAQFDDRGLLDNTLVILTADHGEGLGQHGEIGHIKQLYDSMIHVPLILSYPSDFPQGAMIEEPVGWVDLFPTLADILGIEGPSHPRGESLLPLIHGVDTLERKAIKGETFKPQAPEEKVSIRTAKWKYILTRETGLEEVYYLPDDPEELDNVADSNPEVKADLKSLLEQVMDASGEISSPGENEPTLEPETREMMKSIGYVH